MKGKVAKDVGNHVQRFFYADITTNEEVYSVAQFLRICFAVVTPDGTPIDPHRYNPNEKLSLSFRYSGVDIRRKIAEFGLCFGSGSVAGGPLRSGRFHGEICRLYSALKKFSECPHEDPDLCTDYACFECGNELF